MKLKLGENIRRLRRAARMTQEDFAARMGVSGQAVSRWETGTAYPDIELLPAMAELFSVGLEELMGARPADREYASEAYYAHLESIDDPAARLDHLREMHREFPRDRTVMLRIALLTEELDELRTLVNRLSALSTDRNDYHFLCDAPLGCHGGGGPFARSAGPLHHPHRLFAGYSAGGTVSCPAEIRGI